MNPLAWLIPISQFFTKSSGSQRPSLKTKAIGGGGGGPPGAGGIDSVALVEDVFSTVQFGLLRILASSY